MPKYKLLLKTTEVRSCIVEFPNSVALETYCQQQGISDSLFTQQEPSQKGIEWIPYFGTRGDAAMLPGQGEKQE